MSDLDDLQLVASRHEQAVEIEAYHFLLAGGVVSVSEWLSLTSTTHAALVAAGKRIAAENSAMIGLAGESAHGRAIVLAEVDGGEMAATMSVCDMIDEVVAEGTNGVL